MFSFKTKKTSTPGCINLNSSEKIVPILVEKMPPFGNKKFADKWSLYSDIVYEENLPVCDGQDKHMWSDASINEYVKKMIKEHDKELKQFDVKCYYSLEHGETLIISTKGSEGVGSLLLKFQERVMNDKLAILAQDLIALRMLDIVNEIVSRSITKTCYMARHQECLIITYPGTPVPAAGL